MPFLNLIQDPADFVIFVLAIALAIGVHEAAHAWSADKLGDNTAKLLGRTSINPIVHLDPIGSLLFLFVGFGWGKPVPVNEGNLRQKLDIILVALAGPASNLVSAVILSLFYRFIPIDSLRPVLEVFIFINLSLMVFNLIPLPPLDGSKLLRLIISHETYYMLERYSVILILFLFFFLRVGNSGLGNWLMQVVQYLFIYLTGTPLNT